MIKAILFDLDGTLLPMDNNEFVKGYFGLLCKKLAPYGYEANAMVQGIWTATKAMVMNDGSVSNETVFWKVFAEIMGEEILQYQPLFDEFYIEEFKKTKAFCGYNPETRGLIDWVKEQGLRVVCATNPIFPKLATMHRMNFAGIDATDFEYFTHYENSSFCKPNPAYYTQVLEHCGLKPEECIMVGNDATEDMAAARLGIEVFLLTECLINDKEVDISKVPQGGFEELKEFIASRINCN